MIKYLQHFLNEGIIRWAHGWLTPPHCWTTGTCRSFQQVDHIGDPGVAGGMWEGLLFKHKRELMRKALQEPRSLSYHLGAETKGLRRRRAGLGTRSGGGWSGAAGCVVFDGVSWTVRFATWPIWFSMAWLLLVRVFKTSSCCPRSKPWHVRVLFIVKKQEGFSESDSVSARFVLWPDRTVRWG